jgi:hypothetical protein
MVIRITANGTAVGGRFNAAKRVLWAGLPPPETLGKCGFNNFPEHLFDQVVPMTIYLATKQQQTPTAMSTQTITSYVDSITDSMLDEITKMDRASIVLLSINTPSQVHYGMWEVSADFEINGEKKTLKARTNDEAAIIALKKRHEESCDEIEQGVLLLIADKNESIFDDADFEAKEAANA